jgi:hypothetical protein
MHWKGFGRTRLCPNRGELRTSLRITGVSAEIRIEHLPNISLLSRSECQMFLDVSCEPRVEHNPDL